MQEHSGDCMVDVLLIMSDGVPSELCNMILMVTSMILLLVDCNAMFQQLTREIG